MKIKTLLHVSFAILIITVIVIGSGVMMTAQQVRESIANSQVADKIVRDVFLLNLLTNDYLLNQGSRARTQWESKFDSLTRVLDSATFTHPDELSRFDTIRDEHYQLQPLFFQLVDTARIQEAGALSHDLKKRLSAQIAVKSQTIVYQSLQLALANQQKIARVQNHQRLLFLLFTLIVGGEIIVILFVIANSLIKPVLQLETGTRIIAEGNLDHRVRVTTDNEVGQLSRAFNEMTSHLQQVIADLRLEIQEREQFKLALSKETEQLSITLQSIGDGVITTDDKGGVMLMNPVAERLTGWRQDEAAGKPLSEVFQIIDERSRESIPDPVARLFEADDTTQFDTQKLLVPRHGRERRIAESGAPIRDGNDNRVGVVLVFRDTTAEQQLKEETLKANKLESLGLLAGGIAHDFNNILTSVLGNLSLAKLDLAPDTSAHRLVHQAESASTRAKDLTKQLLSFSKGAIPIKSTASLTKLVQDSADIAARCSRARCEYKLAPDLWEAAVDPGQINQVIQNFVINAAQAMKGEGVVRVTTENVTVRKADNLPLKPGCHIKITVSDSGDGIAPEHLDRIFDPYFTTKEEDTGLRLSITYSIIKNHEGHVAVESRPDVGTTITIYLPANGPIPDASTVSVEGLAIGEAVNGRILVTQDEKIIGQITAKMLSRMGFNVEVAQSGHETIERFQRALGMKRSFDIVLLDLNSFEDVETKDLIQELRAIDPDVKAIVCGDRGDDPMISNYRDFGFSGVALKPFKINDLGSVVKRVLVGSN